MRTIAVLVIILITLVSACLSAELDSKVSGVTGLIASSINTNGIKLVGVTEFTNDSGSIGGSSGVAGKYFSEKFEEFLIKDRKGYKVVDRMTLDKVLKELRLQASGLIDESSTKAILGKISGLDGLVVGSVLRMGMKASISCKVVKLPEAEAVTKESFVAELDSDLASLFGETIVAGSGGEISRIDLQNQSGGLAAVDKTRECPYKIEVISGGAVKPIYTDGKSLYIEANDNEEYSIRVVNKTPEPVAAVLLIDGVNSLYEDGKPVRDVPSRCRPWIVYPSTQNDFVQNGWQINAEKCKTFVFCSDISQSVAAKMGYTNELGMITAVIYKQLIEEVRGMIIEEKSADFGTKEGKEITSKIQTVDFKYNKEPAAILTIKYCGKDKIASMRKL